MLPKPLAWLAAVFMVVFGTACETPLSEGLPGLNPDTARWARNSLKSDFSNSSNSSNSSESQDWQHLSRLDAGDASDALNTDFTKSPLAARLTIEASALPLSALFDGIAEQLAIAWHASEPLSTLVTWSLPEQSAKVVLDQIAEKYNLLWAFENNVLTIQGPTPFAAFYPVDYLNLERAFHSRVGLATEVGTMRGVESVGGGGTANSSSTTIDNLSKQQFWQSLTDDLAIWLPDEGGGARWTVNKDAGVVSLYAPPNAHRRLKDYLAGVTATSQRQVLIEASVVEVLLSDDFEAGIDWQWLAKNLEGFSAVQQLQGLAAITEDTIGRLPTPTGLASFSQQFRAGSFSATFKFLEKFGDARIVSRPQILAMNNQPAVLKVVDNRVYFTVNVERQQSTDSTERTTETQIHTVPVGLVMNVTPQISADNTVMLNVRPSLSRILGFVNDPNPELNTANVTNGVPEIQVREMESVLRVPSGSIAVIGGLMQSVQDDRDEQLPGLASLPGVGSLFGRQSRQRQRTELFIVIKPTVIGAHL